MKKKRLSLKEKCWLYEATLNSIAAWSDGDNLSYLDEPGSAKSAREVLTETNGIDSRPSE